MQKLTHWVEISVGGWWPLFLMMLLFVAGYFFLKWQLRQRVHEIWQRLAQEEREERRRLRASGAWWGVAGADGGSQPAVPEDLSNPYDPVERWRSVRNTQDPVPAGRTRTISREGHHPEQGRAGQ